MTGQEEEMDCPICLDPMTMADHKHPLQCTTKQCGYNFCHDCIESLITSSKDDYMEASDGNRHVKVFLHCPSCRSDLGTSIRETLLLRKADFLLIDGKLREDEELSASQLRMKQVIHSAEVQDAIADARKREAEFFGRSLEEQEEAANELKDDHDKDEVEYEEWGVEADLVQGVHKSIRVPKPPRDDDDNKDDHALIDTTLFGGLEFAMTADEQVYITELMTSGDTTKLALAAQSLNGIGNLCRQGVNPKMRIYKQSSVFQLIEEAEKAHAKKGHHKTAAAAAHTTTAMSHSPAQQRVDAVQQQQQAVRNHLYHMKRYPLPVRMPKYVELQLKDPSNSKFPLKFLDDTWDGTVMDAFSKITIKNTMDGKKVKKKRTENRGVLILLNGGVGRMIDVENTPRILVSTVKSEGGKQGIVKGDVVTHLNGEELIGKTADDLMAAIQDCADRNDGPTFTLVLNAERSTAEALKRRAMMRD